VRETPDIETSSDSYAQRFSGVAGDYLLSIQRAKVRDALSAPFGSTVLEVGGGHGQLVPYLVESGHDVTVIGSSNDCYKRVFESKGGGDVKLVTGDLLNLPFPDNSFDLVISVRLISHIEDWPHLVREFCRVAGTAVVIDYPSTTGINALTPLLFKVKRSIEKNTRTYTSFSKKELIREFSRNDFCVSGLYPQFLLPMVIHRAMKGAAWLQAAEKLCAAAGLTRVFGSPVILRADRCEGRGSR
jgi:ubiquinone/menaquinone biosynthesis C-methylase UbiE